MSVGVVPLAVVLVCSALICLIGWVVDDNPAVVMTGLVIGVSTALVTALAALVSRAAMYQAGLIAAGLVLAGAVVATRSSVFACCSRRRHRGPVRAARGAAASGRNEAGAPARLDRRESSS